MNVIANSVVRRLVAGLVVPIALGAISVGPAVAQRTQPELTPIENPAPGDITNLPRLKSLPGAAAPAEAVPTVQKAEPDGKVTLAPGEVAQPRAESEPEAKPEQEAAPAEETAPDRQAAPTPETAPKEEETRRENRKATSGEKVERKKAERKKADRKIVDREKRKREVYERKKIR